LQPKNKHIVYMVAIMGDDPARNRALKRLAMQIVVQLPDERREAVAVLRFAGQLIGEFLEGDPGGGRSVTPFSLVK
jgi:hypothetical protein